MGKKKEKELVKCLEALEGNKNDVMNDDVACFVTNMYNRANTVRTMAPMSEKMNKFSELYDDLLNLVIDMTTEEVHILDQIR